MANPEVDSTDQYWLKPEQISAMRNIVYDCRPTYLQQRDDAFVALMADGGFRNEEQVSLNVADLDLDDGRVILSPTQQKDYPTENSPDIARVQIADDTIRTLRAYLASRWKDDPDALFPSRSSPRMTTRAARNLIDQLAVEADIRPYAASGGRGQPEDVTPHTLRHSVAYRVIEREGGHLDDVKRRLRHSSLRTTEDEYSHFDVV